MSSRRVAVSLEVTPNQTVASALDWPGWCRAGRDERAALAALASYAERYAPVAEHAGLSFPSTVDFDLVEQVPGGPTTAFAAPECRRPFPQVTAEAERSEVTPAQARRLVDLLTAVWATFDQVAAASPAELRKGPRGGGRDRDEIIDHVIGAETAYARKLGVKLKQPATDNLTAIQELREAIAAVLGCPIGRLTRGAQRLDHALRGSPDGLARPRACLGDAGPGGKPGGAARTAQPGLVGETRRQCGRDAVWAASLKAAAATSGSNAGHDGSSPASR